MHMILAYIGRLLLGALAVLAVYVVIRALWLRGRGRPDWGRELLLAVFSAYAGGMLTQLVVPAWQIAVSAAGGLTVQFQIGAPRAPNLIALSTILSQLRGETGKAVAIMNLVGNTALFVPLGALLPSAFPRLRRWWRVLLAGAAAIAAVETIQYFIGRTADVDDWLLNVVGIMAGYGLYALLAGRKRKCSV